MSSSQHHILEEQLTAYLLGDLPVDKAAEMATHLEACASCRALSEELKPTLQLLGDVLAAPANEGAQLDDQHRARIRKATTPGVKTLTVWPVAKAAVLVGGSVMLAILFWPKTSSQPVQTAQTHFETDAVEVRIGRENKLELEELGQVVAPSAPVEGVSVVAPEPSIDEELLESPPHKAPASLSMLMAKREEQLEQMGSVPSKVSEKERMGPRLERNRLQGASSLNEAEVARGALKQSYRELSSKDEKVYSKAVREDQADLPGKKVQPVLEGNSSLLAGLAGSEVSTKPAPSGTIAGARDQDLALSSERVADQGSLSDGFNTTSGFHGVKARMSKLDEKMEGLLYVEVNRPEVGVVSLYVEFDESTVGFHRLLKDEELSRVAYVVRLVGGVQSPRGTVHLKLDEKEETYPLQDLLNENP